jgi:two-component system, LuxR family, response regulator FixJ
MTPVAVEDVMAPRHSPSRAPGVAAGSDEGRDPEQPIVMVVDDDALMRASLQRLLVRGGLRVEMYASGSDFLERMIPGRAGCVLLDVTMPGLSGLDVQAALNERRAKWPVIFLTGSAHIPIAVAAMRAGAVDFIEKPFDNQHVLDRVVLALERHRHQRRDEHAHAEILRRLGTLTPRELEVLERVVTGETSKEIARALGASPRTIEIHRGRLMDKMAARTLADLVRMRLSSDVESSRE